MDEYSPLLSVGFCLDNNNWQTSHTYDEEQLYSTKKMNDDENEIPEEENFTIRTNQGNIVIGTIPKVYIGNDPQRSITVNGELVFRRSMLSPSHSLDIGTEEEVEKLLNDKLRFQMVEKVFKSESRVYADNDKYMIERFVTLNVQLESGEKFEFTVGNVQEGIYPFDEYINIFTTNLSSLSRTSGQKLTIEKI